MSVQAERLFNRRAFHRGVISSAAVGFAPEVVPTSIPTQTPEPEQEVGPEIDKNIRGGLLFVRSMGTWRERDIYLYSKDQVITPLTQRLRELNKGWEFGWSNALSPDNTLLAALVSERGRQGAVVNRRLVILSLHDATHKVLGTFSRKEYRGIHKFDSFTPVFTKDNRYVAFGRFGRVWDIQTGRVVFTVQDDRKLSYIPCRGEDWIVFGEEVRSGRKPLYGTTVVDLSGSSPVTLSAPAVYPLLMNFLMNSEGACDPKGKYFAAMERSTPDSRFLAPFLNIFETNRWRKIQRIRLTSSGFFAAPSWSPDGEHLAFEQYVHNSKFYLGRFREVPARPSLVFVHLPTQKERHISLPKPFRPDAFFAYSVPYEIFWFSPTAMVLSTLQKRSFDQREYEGRSRVHIIQPYDVARSRFDKGYEFSGTYGSSKIINSRVSLADTSLTRVAVTKTRWERKDSKSVNINYSSIIVDLHTRSIHSFKGGGTKFFHENEFPAEMPEDGDIVRDGEASYLVSGGKRVLIPMPLSSFFLIRPHFGRILQATDEAREKFPLLESEQKPIRDYADPTSMIHFVGRRQRAYGDNPGGLDDPGFDIIRQALSELGWSTRNYITHSSRPARAGYTKADAVQDSIRNIRRKLELSIRMFPLKTHVLIGYRNDANFLVRAIKGYTRYIHAVILIAPPLGGLPDVGGFDFRERAAEMFGEQELRWLNEVYKDPKEQAAAIHGLQEIIDQGGDVYIARASDDLVVQPETAFPKNLVSRRPGKLTLRTFQGREAFGFVPSRTARRNIREQKDVVQEMVSLIGPHPSMLFTKRR